jgi:hypothetical protein
LQDAIVEYRLALQLSEVQRKHVIYSRAGMIDALSDAVDAFGKKEVVETVGEQFESILSGRLKDTTRDIPQSKVLSEVTGSLME